MDADAAADTPRAATWRARAGLIALFALFLAPVVGSFLLHLAVPGWVPFGYTNRGDLVEPPAAAHLDGARFLDGEPAPAADDEAVWILVHASDGSCGETCEAALLAMRQARLALGKDAHRVARWWLVAGDPDERSVAQVLREYAGTRVVQLGRDSPLLAAAQDGASVVQLVDPAGYLILRYGGADPAGAIRKDLKRLLKISTQG